MDINATKGRLRANRQSQGFTYFAVAFPGSGYKYNKDRCIDISQIDITHIC